MKTWEHCPRCHISQDRIVNGKGLYILQCKWNSRHVFCLRCQELLGFSVFYATACPWCRSGWHDGFNRIGIIRGTGTFRPISHAVFKRAMEDRCRIINEPEIFEVLTYEKCPINGCGQVKETVEGDHYIYQSFNNRRIYCHTHSPYDSGYLLDQCERRGFLYGIVPGLPEREPEPLAPTPWAFMG